MLQKWIILTLFALIFTTHPCKAGVDEDRKLFVASKDGNLEAVKSLIKKGANVNMGQYKGVEITPLIIATERGHTDIAKELIGSGADVNLGDKDMITPLHLASERGNIEVVKELIDAGAKIDIYNHHGITPLHAATANGEISVIKELIRAKASLDLPFQPEFTIEFLKNFLPEVAQLNPKDIRGATPLILATANGRIEVVKVLLNAGAAANLGITKDITPITVAHRIKRNDIVSELKKYQK